MSETMRFAAFHEVGEVSLEECPLPVPAGDQALVRLDCCALCTWEQRVYTGENKVQFPFVGGHEFTGEIVAIGDAVDTRNWNVGDRVVGGVTASCGEDWFCRTGHGECCPQFAHGTKLDFLPYVGPGGLSEYACLSTRNLFKVWNVSPQEACLTEPVSCVLHSVVQAGVKMGDYVLVIGAGIMGQLHSQLAQAQGAAVIVSDIDDARTALALELGAKYAVNPAKEDLEARVLEITHGRKCQAVFDTTPIPSLVYDAYKCVSNAGSVTLYSSIHPRPGESRMVEVDPGWMHSWSIRTLGTANSNWEDFTRAASLISEGVVNLKPFIHGEFPLEEVDAAFRRAIEPDAMRVIVNMR